MLYGNGLGIRNAQLLSEILANTNIGLRIADQSSDASISFQPLPTLLAPEKDYETEPKMIGGRARWTVSDNLVAIVAANISGLAFCIPLLPCQAGFIPKPLPKLCSAR